MKKKIVLVMVMIVLFGCRNGGVGEEPVEVKNVTVKELHGSWKLSKIYTTEWIVKRLPMDIEKYFLKIMKDGELEYRFFYVNKEKKPIIKKGKWILENNRLLLKEIINTIVYIDAKGEHFNNLNNKRILNPVRSKPHKFFQTFQELRFTKKDNKLILWDYGGDPDARRYFMWEKRE